MEIDTSKLRPRICSKCGTVNPYQEMINTAYCLEKDSNGLICGGLMVPLEEEKKDLNEQQSI